MRLFLKDPEIDNKAIKSLLDNRYQEVKATKRQYSGEDEDADQYNSYDDEDYIAEEGDEQDEIHYSRKLGSSSFYYTFIYKS